MNFSEKVVLITGAASGIGREAALTYAKAGAKVIVSDIQEEKGAQTVADIKAAGGEAIFQPANVANYEEVKALIAKTVETYGRLDIAVNNAGLGSAMARTSATEIKDWDLVIAVNQTGVFYCMKEELKVMEKQGSGSIINIASMAGLKGFGMQIAYAASKHAVVGMTRSAAQEYARVPIRVNAICPVFTQSPMLDQLFEMQPDLNHKLVKAIPMRRYGEASEIVNAIMWMSSDSASFMTGLALPVDGGFSS